MEGVRFNTRLKSVTTRWPEWRGAGVDRRRSRAASLSTSLRATTVDRGRRRRSRGGIPPSARYPEPVSTASPGGACPGPSTSTVRPTSTTWAAPPTARCWWLLHGLGGSHLNWSAIGPDLSPYGRGWSPLDLVGHGLTPVGGRTADHRGPPAAGERLPRGAGAGRPAILMGNSMGGLVAALQAARSPTRWPALVLVDPALPTARLGLVHPRVVANFLLCAVPGLGEGYLSSAPAPHHRRAERAPGAGRLLRRRRPGPPERWWRPTWSSPRGWTGPRPTPPISARPARCRCCWPGPAAHVRRLDGLHQPTLLLQGPGTCWCRCRRPGGWPTPIRGGGSRWPPSVGHVPMLEAPDWTDCRHRGLARAGGGLRRPVGLGSAGPRRPGPCGPRRVRPAPADTRTGDACPL